MPPGHIRFGRYIGSVVQVAEIYRVLRRRRRRRSLAEDELMHGCRYIFPVTT